MGPPLRANAIGLRSGSTFFRKERLDSTRTRALASIRSTIRPRRTEPSRLSADGEVILRSTASLFPVPCRGSRVGMGFIPCNH